MHTYNHVIVLWYSCDRLLFRQWGREDDSHSGYSGSQMIKDEEDYAGHATAYNSPIYGGTFKSHNGSLSSKVQFYNDRNMIFPS